MIDDPAQWLQFVAGDAYDPARACQAADAFAVSNDAEVEGCSTTTLGFKVKVRSSASVGSSLLPGMEDQRAVATAVAVIEPRCQFYPPEPTEEPEPLPTPPAEPEEEEPEPIRGLVCDGNPWDIDPEDPVLPDVGDLFHVRLTGDDE
ncbi:hypothetical protein [Streptomyces hydrogenans]|uniref:hypothetical protein n=1 Tax=Streptomyces hydrogenans TaxID=1873719 RepID=UPI003D722187